LRPDRQAPNGPSSLRGTLGVSVQKHQILGGGEQAIHVPPTWGLRQGRGPRLKKRKGWKGKYYRKRGPTPKNRRRKRGKENENKKCERGKEADLGKKEREKRNAGEVGRPLLPKSGLRDLSTLEQPHLSAPGQLPAIERNTSYVSGGGSNSKKLAVAPHLTPKWEKALGGLLSSRQPCLKGNTGTVN